MQELIAELVEVTKQCQAATDAYDAAQRAADAVYQKAVALRHRRSCLKSQLEAEIYSASGLPAPDFMGPSFEDSIHHDPSGNRFSSGPLERGPKVGSGKK